MNEHTESQNTSTCEYIVVDENKTQFYSYCLICGQPVRTTSFLGNYVCICDECKDAVLYVKENFIRNKEIL